MGLALAPDGKTLYVTMGARRGGRRHRRRHPQGHPPHRRRRRSPLGNRRQPRRQEALHRQRPLQRRLRDRRGQRTGDEAHQGRRPPLGLSSCRQPRATWKHVPRALPYHCAVLPSMNPFPYQRTSSARWLRLPLAVAAASLALGCSSGSRPAPGRKGGQSEQHWRRRRDRERRRLSGRRWRLSGRRRHGRHGRHGQAAADLRAVPGQDSARPDAEPDRLRERDRSDDARSFGHPLRGQQPPLVRRGRQDARHGAAERRQDPRGELFGESLGVSRLPRLRRRRQVEVSGRHGDGEELPLRRQAPRDAPVHALQRDDLGRHFRTSGTRGRRTPRSSRRTATRRASRPASARWTGTSPLETTA